MQMPKLIVILTLAAFSAGNVYAFSHGLDSLVAFFTGADAWTQLAMFDLVIALSLVSVWIHRDARARGESSVPWLVLTWTTGSIGPLVYLLRRPA